MLKTSPLMGLVLFLSVASAGCMNREKLCYKHCDKGHECEEGEPGHIDLSDCKSRCRDLVEDTKDSCTQEMVRWSKCMKKRYDCDRGRESACDSQQDDLRSCQNANR